MKNASLLVVDVQYGFTELCPAELPVPNALAIVPAVNALLALPWARIDATQDWHPADHCSFDLYPPHCVAGTLGAEFIRGVDTDRFQTIWSKGYERNRDTYAVTSQHPSFIPTLRASGVDTVVLCGIATNICVFFAARDLKAAGFNVVIVEDACAGIDVPAAGLYQAEAKAAGLALGIRYAKLAELVCCKAARVK